jgi:hypothetical protein
VRERVKRTYDESTLPDLPPLPTMAKGRKGIKKVTRRKPVSNPFLEPDSPTVQEAGEVEVPSSSQTNTASEVNIESTPDQAQESPGGAPFSADITKASTSSPPPLTSSGAAEATTSISPAAHSQMPANELDTHEEVNAHESNAQSEGTTESQERETAVDPSSGLPPPSAPAPELYTEEQLRRSPPINSEALFPSTSNQEADPADGELPARSASLHPTPAESI